MREREKDTLVGLVIMGLLVGLALVLVGCGGGSVTGPSDIPTGTSGSVSQSSTPAATPSPTPAPTGATPYAEFSKDPKDGSGTLFNPTNHAVIFTLEYFDATDFQNQKLLKKIQIEVPAKGSYAVKAFVPEQCGLKLTIQLDASTTTHVGHVIYEVKTDECKCEKEPITEAKVVFGEWSECKEGEKGCFKSREVTKTTTITDPCTNEVKTTVEKSVETQECECVCVPVWEESTKVTYTEWGACEKQRDGSCAKYREKTTEIWHTNSCTKETKLYKTNTEREFEKCECQVEQCKVTQNYGQQLPTGVSASFFSESKKANYNDPEDACGFYGLDGYKLEPVDTPWISTGDYPVVIIKAGSDKSCTTNENTSWFNVEKGDALTASLCDGKDISHVIVCECPEEE